MTAAAFIATYAIVATAVGMAYFACRRWTLFLDTHAIRGEAREVLMLHLMLGAAAVGAAWPVGIMFAAYALLFGRSRAVAADQRSTGRVPIL